MADITVRDCDIVHLCDNFRPKEAYWANAVWHIQASHKKPICYLLFEDLRIYVDIPNTLNITRKGTGLADSCISEALNTGDIQLGVCKRSARAVWRSRTSLLRIAKPAALWVPTMQTSFLPRVTAV